MYNLLIILIFYGLNACRASGIPTRLMVTSAPKRPMTSARFKPNMIDPEVPGYDKGLTCREQPSRTFPIHSIRARPNSRTSEAGHDVTVRRTTRSEPPAPVSRAAVASAGTANSWCGQTSEPRGPATGSVRRGVLKSGVRDSDRGHGVQARVRYRWQVVEAVDPNDGPSNESGDTRGSPDGVYRGRIVGATCRTQDA